MLEEMAGGRVSGLAGWCWCWCWAKLMVGEHKRTNERATYEIQISEQVDG